MYRNLLLGLALCAGTSLGAQTVILDFEEPATTTTFSYFGNVDLSDTNLPIVANPDPSGINTSDTVLQFDERAGSEPFAGAFSNPVPATPVNLTTLGEVCMDVWMPEISSITLKLEESATAADWTQTRTNTTTNAWEQLCYKVGLPSEADGSTIAAGNVYAKLVFFPGLDVVPATNLTYYIDNFILQEGNTGPVDVTFAVDMSTYEEAFTTVYVSGTFNEFSGTANPLSDDDGDGIWTTTLPIEQGAQEYLFTLDDFSGREVFDGTDVCTKTTIDGDNRFVNRAVAIADPVALDTVCFNSCYACGEGIDITFELNTSDSTVSAEGIFIAGGGNFGNPGDYPLSDDDGDGIYTITVERAPGFASFYTYTNGACGDYSCKEMIEGQACARADNFNDRFFGPVTQDTTIANCFGNCAGCASSSVRDLSELGISVEVRPTATDGLATLVLSGATTHEAVIAVVGVNGRLLHSGFAQGDSTYALDLTTYPRGVYLVRVQYRDAQSVVRVVRQ